ncbi:MAG: hypothetical protein J1E82_07940 [Muribaculaceae bacterium]|nr:hypothetical protein [Muribaculaceae bacterium]
MKGLFWISLILLAVSCRGTERTEEITADITAAQMEGRRAASILLNTNYKDTLELQKALLEAKSRQSQYLISGKPKSAEAFDSSFVSTIRTVNPELGKKLHP